MTSVCACHSAAKASASKRDGAAMKLPDGQPLAFEFLDPSELFQPHISPWRQNMKKLGIAAGTRVVDPSQYKARVDSFDFDLTALNLGGSGGGTPVWLDFQAP